MSTPQPGRPRLLRPVHDNDRVTKDTGGHAPAAASGPGSGPAAGGRQVDLPDLELADVDPATAGEHNAVWAVDLPEDEIEAALREAAEGRPGGIPADPQAPTGPGPGEPVVPLTEPRTILPAWWWSDQRWAVVRWWVRYRGKEAWRLVIYLLSVYPWRAARRSPRGLARAIAATWRWVFDHESLDLRRALAGGTTRNDAVTFLAVSRQRNERVKRRGSFAVTVACLLALVSLGVWTLGPWWARLVLAVVAVGVLGKLGSTPDDPIIDRAQITPRMRRLTADVIERAFVAAGLASEKKPITIPVPITRDGPGWLAVIDLDYSVTAEQAIRAREKIAAGLDMDEVQVWPERVRGTTGSARRLRLWVADEDPFEKPSGGWPLVRAGTVDVFKAFPFGTDQRSRVITLALMFTHLLIGSIPRIGKTFAARLAAMAAALDPIVELHVWDGKGGQDWRPFTLVAHRCGFGARDEVAGALLGDLQGVQADMNRRYDTMATLGPDVCPDSQLTRELAERRGLALWPILIAIDEFQRYCAHPQYGDAIVEVLIDLAKVGPAVGIMLILATQKPDAESIPSALRDVLGTRLALKTKTWQSSDAVLGSGSYKSGLDASKFLRSHKGVGILVGADDSGAITDESVTVRTYFADLTACQSVCSRARTLRENAGLLSGQAAGLEAPNPEREDRTRVLLDVLSIWPAGQSGTGPADKVWNDRLAGLLADYSSRYEGWAGPDLTAALAKHQISTVQINRSVDGDPRANRRGTAHQDVTAALQAAGGATPPQPLDTGGEPGPE